LLYYRSMTFLVKWLISTLAIIIAAYLIPGVTVDSLLAAFIAALVLGLINVVIKPLVVILTLPVNILTLGLFTLVINALLIMLTSWIVDGFTVANFWWALLFGVILSLLTFALNQLAD